MQVGAGDPGGKRAGGAIGLEAAHARDVVGFGDGPAQAHAAGDQLGEGAELDDALAAGNGIERRRAVAVENQVAVSVVLQENQVKFLADLGKLAASFHWGVEADGVVHGGHGVDERDVGAGLALLGHRLPQ